MEYLLFLQNLRESAPTFVNEGILFLSEFMGGTGALAVMALVYWCISKQAGSFMLLNFSSAYMMNQTLKNIFCVSRPFLRDARIQPYTDATGYSFPSGHTMLGTAVYSSAAIWQKKRKWVAALCAVMILLTAFGRNWIGVHTPEDVIVGILVSLAVVFAQYRMLQWLEQKHGKDILVLLCAVIWAAALLLFIPNSEKTCGIFLGVFIGWFVERRWIRFEVGGSLIRRVLRYVLGMVFVLAICQCGSVHHKQIQVIPEMFVTFFVNGIADLKIVEDFLFHNGSQITACAVAEEKTCLDKAGNVIKIMGIGAAVEIKHPNVVFFHEEIIHMEVTVADAVMSDFLGKFSYLLFDLADSGHDMLRYFIPDPLFQRGKILRFGFAHKLEALDPLVGADVVNCTQQITAADKNMGFISVFVLITPRAVRNMLAR